MRQADAADVRKRAEAAFAAGLYCAESVVHALAAAHGRTCDVLPRLATAFCSGMARTRGPCGALTGAVMGIGLCLGRDAGDQSVDPAYAVTRQLVDAFETEFGARNCHELLACDLATPEGQSKFRQERLHERCRLFTGRAAEIAARLISESRSRA